MLCGMPPNTRPGRIRTLVELDLDGEIHGFAHAEGGEAGPLQIEADQTSTTGRPRRFGAGVEIQGLPVRATSLLGGSGGRADATIVVNRSALDLVRARSQVQIQRCRGRILWWQEGTALEDAYEIHRGLLRSPKMVAHPDGAGQVTVQIAPAVREMDARFPPAAIGDDGRFPAAPERSLSQVVPVIYGDVRGIPLYAVSDVTADPVRLLLAGHPIVSTDLNGLLRYTDGTALAAGARPVLQAVDDLGGIYSYVEISLAEYGVDANVHVSDLTGWPSPAGGALDRLGDVLVHAWRTYAGEPGEALDEGRVEHARPSLNRFRIGAVFNAASSRGTLIRALESRFGPQFPVSFGFSGGRLGWDSLVLPSEAEAVRPVRTLYYGVHAPQRGAIEETSADDVRDDLRLAFQVDGYHGMQGDLRVDPSNNEFAAEARSLWGIGPRVDLSAPDVPDAGTAYLLATDMVRKLSRVRIRVGYRGLTPDWNQIPLMSVVHVVDQDVGWSHEPFLVESVAPRLDGRVDLGLVSFGGAPTF